MISEKSLLVCYSNSGGEHIGSIEIKDIFLDEVNGQQRMSDIDNVDLAVCPKNLAIEKVENFNNDVISLIAWEGTSFHGTKFHLFFEPIPTLEEKLVLPFLGGIELDKSHSCQVDPKVNSEGYIRDNHTTYGNVCWTRCNETPGKGILGASVTSKEGDEKSELTLLLYVYSDLQNQISHSSKCVQKLGLDQAISPPYTASTEYISSITTKFVPWSNENSAVDSNCANNSNGIIHKRKLIISNGPLIYLYDIKILSRDEDCEKNDFPWKATCYQLFCHDAHKSNVLHVQPYSPKLPNLFFSADSDKKLHAWHWQTQEKGNIASE